MNIPRFLSLLLTLTLLPACQEKTPDRPATDVSESVAEPSASEDSQSLFGLIESRATLSQLRQLLERSGLDSMLLAEGPVTLFAPTNDAFSELKTSTDALSDDELKRLLENHVIQTRMQTLDIPGEMTIGTLNGEEVSLHPGDDGLDVSVPTGNRARVVTPDLSASNGVIHMIDDVLVPVR